MIVDYNFKNEFLTSGKAYNNFIFENCPEEFLDLAKEFLDQNNTDTIICNVFIDEQIEKQIENTLSKCKEDYEIKILVRDYITSVIEREVIRNSKPKLFRELDLTRMINDILEGNYQNAIANHKDCKLPVDVSWFVGKLGKAEINFYLRNTKNVFIQRAINNFVSTEDRFIKTRIFTTNERLPSYVNQADVMIQSPHDYISRNVEDYIEFDGDENCED